jgi:hypothetical protein
LDFAEKWSATAETRETMGEAVHSDLTVVLADMVLACSLEAGR